MEGQIKARNGLDGEVFGVVLGSGHIVEIP